MVTLHGVLALLSSMQISISSWQSHNVKSCGRSRHLATTRSLGCTRSSPDDLQGVGAAYDPGVVDVDVVSAKFADRVVDDILHRLDRGQVRADDGGAPACRSHLLRCFVRWRAPDQRDVRPALGERDCKPLA